MQAAQCNAEPKLAREYFFSHPRRIFSLPSFLKNLFPPTHGLTLKPTMTAINVKHFVDRFVLTFNRDDFGRDRRASANKGLPQCGVQYLIERLCFLHTFVVGGQFSAFNSRTDGNPRNVTSNAMTTVQTSKDSAKNGRQNANPSQNKKSCNQPHKPTQFAAHFILPHAPKPTHHPTGGHLIT